MFEAWNRREPFKNLSEPNKEFERLTNRGALEDMDDDQLAFFLDKMQTDAYENGFRDHCIADYPSSWNEWISWLNSPSNEDGDGDG